jgi:hypothetical protein
MTRTRIETVLAAAFAILALVTVKWPTWIEAIFGVDPDAGIWGRETFTLGALRALD